MTTSPTSKRFLLRLVCSQRVNGHNDHEKKPGIDCRGAAGIHPDSSASAYHLGAPGDTWRHWGWF